MVVAANHVGDAHIPVVHHHAEVVGGGAVGTGDNQVVECFVGNADVAFDQVMPFGYAVERGFETHHGVAAFGNFGQSFAGFGAPAAVVCGGAFFFGLLAHGFQLFFAGIAMVGVP